MSRLLERALLGGLPTESELAGGHGLVGERPDPAWRLLLRAGVEATERRAGQHPRRDLPRPAPAALDPRPPCSEAAAEVLTALLRGEDGALLPEAAALLQAAGQRLPASALPDALSLRTEAHRRAVLPLFGPRARWLAAENPEWAWALTPPPRSEAALALTWREGRLSERAEALEFVRDRDPAEGRRWLREVWADEAAEARLELLRALRVKLSLDDEPLLEASLDDRSARVRRLAAGLLSRLPHSRLVHRMRTRLEPLIRLQGARGGVLRRLVGQRPRLELTLPARFSRDLERDGLTEPGELGLGPRSWWLVQLLAAVPPGHWAATLQASPDELLKATAHEDWAAVEGWSRAAEASAAEAWLLPLMRWWRSAETSTEVPRARVVHWLDALGHALPEAQAEATALRLLRSPDLTEANRLATLLERMPRPWSERLGRAWLAAARQSLSALDGEGQHELLWWELCVADAAVSLPPILLDEAALPDVAALRVRRWRGQLEAFAQTLSRRRRLIEEIRP